VPILLDVNVLVALFWYDHTDNDAAWEWFRVNEKNGWATCPFTQAAFVRIVSNPSFSRESVSPVEAITLLEEAVDRSSHEFWPDHLSLAEAAAYLRPDISGHKQITDAYLLGLAIHRRTKFATFDRRLASLLPQRLRKDDWIITVPRRVH
jgi:toxin-antitoxin system PIN domain toxin